MFHCSPTSKSTLFRRVNINNSVAAHSESLRTANTKTKDIPRLAVKPKFVSSFQERLYFDISLTCDVIHKDTDHPNELNRYGTTTYSPSSSCN